MKEILNIFRYLPYLIIPHVKQKLVGQRTLNYSKVTSSLDIKYIILSDEDCVELSDAFGEAYRGHRNITKSGLPCQEWASNYPYDHWYQDEGIEGNYCRLPASSYSVMNGPWCYNGNGTDPEREACDIPFCRVKDGTW